MIGYLKWFFKFIILFWCLIDIHVYAYQLQLESNSPIITRSLFKLNATLVDDNGRCVNKVLTFHYEDDAFPENKIQSSIQNCEKKFSVELNVSITPSNYRYRIDVYEELLPVLIKIKVAQGDGQFSVTEYLNGQLQLFQNNTNISKNSKNIYVSTSLETVHKIELGNGDFEYLNKCTNSIIVHWFVDCLYQGNSTSYIFSSNYTQPDSQHEVLGIVVANFGPSPQPTPTPSVSTTTISPNKTTTASLTITPITSFMINTSTTALKIDINSSNHIINSTYTSDCQQIKHADLLLSAIQLKNQQQYGFFSRSVIVKDPVTNVKTQGNVWIQEGEILDLQVYCNGSGPFRYCAHYVQGPFNVTGDELCSWEKSIAQCKMQFSHYFREPTNYTLVVIVANDVSKVVTLIGINIYKVKKQPQISVIVVPVTFSSIAVIIIVFGIAYYFQNRSRYMVEVADFDFANNSDMEYKTFRERLRDAISQAINRIQDYSEYDGSDEPIGGMATPQNQKYGSMQ